MRKLLLTFIILFIPNLSFSNDNADLVDMSLEDLMEVKVTTASKKEQSIQDATSIITVITKDEIEKSGARTLQDILIRVPGFFQGRIPTWPLYSTRGVISDGNDHFLLLIDGHSQNSILGQGSSTQDQIPNLIMVEQIEIIRGPGSVLWGSSAVMGIINIKTKTGGKKDEVQVAYSDRDGLMSENYQMNINEEAYKGTVTFTHWRSNGYWNDEVDNTSEGQYNRAISCCGGGDNNEPRFDKQNESFDLYGNFILGNDIKLQARVLDQSVQYFWDSYETDESNQSLDSELRLRKTYLQLSKVRKYDEKLSVEYLIYLDMMAQNRWPVNFQGRDSTGTNGGLGTQMPIHQRMQDQTDEETAFGLEALINYDFSDNHQLKVGFKYVRTEVGPNRDTRFNIENNRPTDGSDNGGTAGERPNYVGVFDAVDVQKAVYFEDTINFSKTTYFYGARVESNNWREDSVVALPRGGVIYKPNNDTGIKYIINTGYLRPNAKYSKTNGQIFDYSGMSDASKASSSEKIISQDLQYSVQKNNMFFAATLYHMTIQDFISFWAFSSWATNVGDERVINSQGYRNVGEVTTNGLELEVKKTYSDKHLLYANAAINNARLDNDKWRGGITDSNNDMINVPKYTFNVGMDFGLTDKVTLNYHLNGFLRQKINTGGPWDVEDSTNYSWLPNNGKTNYETIDRFFLNTALRFQNYGKNKQWGGKVYIYNLTNNVDYIGQAINLGYYSPRGRTIGVNLTYSF